MAEICVTRIDVLVVVIASVLSSVGLTVAVMGILWSKERFNAALYKAKAERLEKYLRRIT